MKTDIYIKQEVDVKYIVVEFELDKIPYTLIFDVDESKLVNYSPSLPNPITGELTSDIKYTIYNGINPNVTENEVVVTKETDTTLYFLLNDDDEFCLELNGDGELTNYWIDIDDVVDELGLTMDY